MIVAAFATRRSATAEVTLTGPAEDLRGTAVVTGGGSARLDLASGLADVEADVPCTPGTRFQLCSVSKLDPYREFLAERIMSPLELTQTTMGGVPPGAARGYSDGQPVAPWNLDVIPAPATSGPPRAISPGSPSPCTPVS